MNLDFFFIIGGSQMRHSIYLLPPFPRSQGHPTRAGRATHPTSGHGHNNSKESLRGRKEDRALFGRSTAAARRLDAVIVSGTAAAAAASVSRARPASKRLLIGDDVQFILFFDGFPP